MVVAVEAQAVLLDDDLDKLAEPNIGDAVLLCGGEVTGCAESDLNVPLTDAVWFLLKQRVQTSANLDNIG